jgi:hypothetical protein
MVEAVANSRVSRPLTASEHEGEIEDWMLGTDMSQAAAAGGMASDAMASVDPDATSTQTAAKSAFVNVLRNGL